MKNLAKYVGILGAVLWLSAATPVFAQATSVVVGTCGTATYPTTASSGVRQYPTQDTTGAACGSGGGGGGGNVNITGVNSAPPSLTNPLFIANAEAADTTGTFTNATQTTSITNSSADGYATGLISINGTYGTASGVFEVSDDAGTTFYPVQCLRSDGSISETGYTALTNTNRQWVCPVQGNDSIRIRSTAVASGTVNARVGVSAAAPSTPDHALCVATDGTLCAPQAGTANRVLTATNLTLNTDTVICPTATNPVTTEIYFTTAGVGVGVNGQTLTTATPGATATNSPDFAIGIAGTLYTFPVAPSNAVHGYGAAGVVRCIQTLRQ